MKDNDNKDNKKFKCASCGKEKSVDTQDPNLFHHPLCCGKKMYIAS